MRRAYRYCQSCRRGQAGFDRWAGLQTDSLTPCGRRMAVRAGSKMSFDAASELLRELCGLRISDQTIRRACDAVGRRAKTYLEQDPRATRAVAAAPGERECSMDGAKVNTTEGWREIRAVVMSCREAGERKGVRHWRDRHLPAPSARVVWAGIADSQAVGRQVDSLARRLGWKRGEQVSVLGDGIPWLWAEADKHLPDHEGCLDIWHMMEHLHAAGRVLHTEGEAARRWAECQRALIFRHGARVYLKDHLLPRVRASRRGEAERETARDGVDESGGHPGDTSGDTSGGTSGGGGERARALRALWVYLWRHRGRMPYRDRLRRGLSIGSGQVEGVCKNTLNTRLRKNSPRWRPERADHMAALCCLHTSGQWEQFWSAAA